MERVDKVLSKDAILGADDKRLETVDVPEWGGIIHVRSLTGKQRDEVEVLMSKRKKGEVIDVTGFMVKLIRMSACDADGKPLFHEKDEDALNQKSCSALQKVFDKALTVSGLKEDDIPAGLRDFDKDPNGNSGSV